MNERPPFAAELADDEPAAVLYLPNGATRDSRLIAAGDDPPFAPELAADKPPHESGIW